MLTKTIPSYLYIEYQGDAALEAFVAAYNVMAQEYVDWFNQIGLPVYTGPLISDSLLDWVAMGLYGISRPALTGSTPVTDDVFKRVISWHFYKDDGKVFDVRWLKRRIMRFLEGVNGTGQAVNQTYQISVRFPGSSVVLINVLPGIGLFDRRTLFNGSQFNTRKFNETILQLQNYADTTLAPILKDAIDAGVLELPFQYSYIVGINP